MKRKGKRIGVILLIFAMLLCYVPTMAFAEGPAETATEPIEETVETPQNPTEGTPETADGIPVDKDHFPDDAFRDWVSTNVDTDENNFLSEEERNKVTVMTTEVGGSGGLPALPTTIEDLSGIQNFTQLSELNCSGTSITALDVSELSNLWELYCRDTPLESLNIDGLTNLRQLRLENTKITQLDVSGLTELVYLSCNGTGIRELDLSGVQHLESMVGPALLALHLPTEVSSDSIHISSEPIEIHIEDGVTRYDLSQSAPHIESGRIKELSGATQDKTTLTDLEEGQLVSYEYDCGNGYMLPVTIYFRWADEYVRQGVKETTIQAHASLTEYGIRLDWEKSEGYSMDYYEVFRSTKENSGFGMDAFYKTKMTNYTNTRSLKRGTRYYYKVRGVRTLLDGTVAYTRWSNKVECLYPKHPKPVPFDTIIEEGINAINMATGDYATLAGPASEAADGPKVVTVTIDDGSRKIKDVYEGIISTIRTLLRDYNDCVATITEKGNDNNSIDLVELFAGSYSDSKAKIRAFTVALKTLGIKTSVQLAFGDATLSALDGKDFTVMLANAETPQKTAEYQIVFEVNGGTAPPTPGPAIPWTPLPSLPSMPSTQTPSITGDDAQVEWSQSGDGSTLTLTPKDGYVIEDVTVNGVSKGAVDKLEGLRTGDVVVVKTAKQVQAPTNAEIKAGVEATSLSAHSELTKKGIRIEWEREKGYKVDYYEVFRSTKKNSGYGKTPYYQTKDGDKTSYVNTKGLKKGTRYYYKVRGVRLVGGEKVYTESAKAWRLWKK